MTAGRIQWLRERLEAGQQAHCRVTSMRGELTVRIRLLPPAVIDSTVKSNTVLLAMLMALEAELCSNIAVDHGHRTSTGESHVAIKL